MSQHRIKLEWRRSSDDFAYETYNRRHNVTFKSDQTIAMSAAVAYRGDAELIDPEEAFVASLASCHMLTFLALAARRRLTVNSYRDEAIGYMEKNAQGKLAITRVTLRPQVDCFDADGQPLEAESMRELHHQAHEGCFIANSVITQVTVEAATG